MDSIRSSSISGRVYVELVLFLPELFDYSPFLKPSDPEVFIMGNVLTRISISLIDRGLFRFSIYRTGSSGSLCCQAICLFYQRFLIYWHEVADNIPLSFYIF